MYCYIDILNKIVQYILINSFKQFGKVYIPFLSKRKCYMQNRSVIDYHSHKHDENQILVHNMRVL